MRTAAALLVVLSASVTAHAQNVGSAIFLEGAVLGDRDPTHFRPDDPRLVPGGSVTIGFRLSPRLSVRFDAEIPARDAHTYDDGSGGFSTISTHIVESIQTITYGGLVGWHVGPANNRVDVALLAGLSTAASDTRESWTEDILGKDGSVVRHDSGSSHYSSLKGALTFGVDVEVPINPHLSIVPEVRFHTYSLYGTVTRPKIAIRWTF